MGQRSSLKRRKPKPEKRPLLNLAREDQVAGAVSRDYFKALWEKQRLPLEVENAFKNYNWVVSQWQETLYDFTQITEKRAPAVCVGSGASLDNARKLLPDWDGIIYCNDSQASTLQYYEAAPTYVCVSDPKVNEPIKLAVEKWDMKCRTVFCPFVPRLMAEAGPGWHRKYLFRIYTSSSNWYNYFKYAYKFINTEITPFAASVQMELAMAQMQDHTPVFLAGVDMGDKRALECRYIDKKWRSNRRIEPFLNHKTFDGKRTTGALLHHKLALLTVVLLGLNRLSPEKAIPIQTSQSGIINELPYIPLEEVIRKQGKVTISPEEYDRTKREIEIYLASKDTYFIRCGNGRFIGGILFTSERPYEELPKNMDMMIKDADAMLKERELPAGMKREFLVPPEKEKEMEKIRRLHEELLMRGWWKHGRESLAGF